MENPCHISDGVIELRPIRPLLGQCHRVEQTNSCAFAFELNQPVLVAVPVSRSAFGIGSQRAGAFRQQLTVALKAIQSVDDVGHARSWFSQQMWFTMEPWVAAGRHRP